MTEDTLLYRQINIDWIDNGEVSSQAFRPTPKDKDKLSLYSSEVFSAEEAFDHFLDRGLTTEGVMGLTNSEFDKTGIPTTQDNDPFLGHVFADYSSKGKSAQRTASKKLKVMANQRGWLHPQED